MPGANYRVSSPRQRPRHRLREIREYEWNNFDIKIHEEVVDVQKGVRCGESALEAIARHMVEVLQQEGK